MESRHERQRAAAAARRAAIASTHRAAHPCRADLDREEDRALAALRPRAEEKILDRRRSVSASRPAASSPSSAGRRTISARSSRASTSCARSIPASRYQTLPFVRPGGEILLRVDGWPKVERVLQAIDAVEALAIDPADAAPEYWRHLHNRLAAGHEPRAYTREQHAHGSSAGGSAMTRFGYVMATYFAMLGVWLSRLRSSRAEADLERQRQHADRALSPCDRPATCTSPSWSWSRRRSRSRTSSPSAAICPRACRC